MSKEHTLFLAHVTETSRKGFYFMTIPWMVLADTRLLPLALSDPWHTVYPKKYAHGFVVLCFGVVMQSFIMNSHEVFVHIHQGCFAGTGAIVRLPQCQWSKPDGYGEISQCITTTKHSKAENRVHISWDILYPSRIIPPSMEQEFR